jgi:lipopolysaccharide export LptBFGC system permease protein LptF
VSAPDAFDHLDRHLAALPASAADETRDARVRVRCHAILAARRTSASRAQHRAQLWKQIVAPILVGAFCTLYFSALVWRVLH